MTDNQKMRDTFEKLLETIDDKNVSQKEMLLIQLLGQIVAYITEQKRSTRLILEHYKQTNGVVLD